MVTHQVDIFNFHDADNLSGCDKYWFPKIIYIYLLSTIRNVLYNQTFESLDCNKSITPEL